MNTFKNENKTESWREKRHEISTEEEIEMTYNVIDTE